MLRLSCVLEGNYSVKYRVNLFLFKVTLGTKKGTIKEQFDIALPDTFSKSVALPYGVKLDLSLGNLLLKGAANFNGAELYKKEFDLTPFINDALKKVENVPFEFHDSSKPGIRVRGVEVSVSLKITKTK